MGLDLSIQTHSLNIKMRNLIKLLLLCVVFVYSVPETSIAEVKFGLFFGMSGSTIVDVLLSSPGDDASDDAAEISDTEYSKSSIYLRRMIKL